MMRRSGAAVLATSLIVGLTGCSVPHPRGDQTIDKVAATRDQVARLYEDYREIRNAATELLDPKPLSTVETGPVLAIDTGSFAVAAKLNRQGEVETGPIDVARVETPRFGKYPLWFFAVVRDAERGVQKLQVFERSTAVDPWLLTASPEALASTQIPGLRRDGTGHAVTVEPDDARGMAMSAQQAAEAYARVLTDPDTAAGAGIVEDAFIRQMRDIAETNASLDSVTFSQTWAAEPVRYVLRASDGGSLAFVTLLRKDQYIVPVDRKITWPAGSPQQALLEDGIQGSSGNLNYYHQIVIHLPGGTAKPRVIAQYGGVVQGEVGLDQAVDDATILGTESGDATAAE